jgi:hypothetical protein
MACEDGGITGHNRTYKAADTRGTVNLTLQLALVIMIRTLKVLSLSPAAAPATAMRKDSV